MAGVLLPFLKWFIGKSGSKGPKVLNFLVRSPWSTIDVIVEVRLHINGVSYFALVILVWRALPYAYRRSVPCGLKLMGSVFDV